MDNASHNTSIFNRPWKLNKIFFFEIPQIDATAYFRLWIKTFPGMWSGWNKRAIWKHMTNKYKQMELSFDTEITCSNERSIELSYISAFLGIQKGKLSNWKVNYCSIGRQQQQTTQRLFLLPTIRFFNIMTIRILSISLFDYNFFFQKIKLATFWCFATTDKRKILQFFFVDRCVFCPKKDKTKQRLKSSHYVLYKNKDFFFFRKIYCYFQLCGIPKLPPCWYTSSAHTQCLLTNEWKKAIKREYILLFVSFFLLFWNVCKQYLNSLVTHLYTVSVNYLRRQYDNSVNRFAISSYIIWCGCYIAHIGTSIECIKRRQY